MKRTIIVLVLFVAICSVLYAQRPNSNLPSGAFIEIDNVKLRLGMSKSEVAEKLVGTSLKKLNEDLWVIGKGPVSYTHLDVYKRQEKSSKALRR